jgi:hypothetical protein
MAKIQDNTLESLFEIRNSEDVKAYLLQYPELESILVELHTEIYKLFGNDTDTILGFWRNVEEKSDVSLWVTILTSLSSEKASEQLDLLDNWFVDIIPRSKGSLNFDTKRR